MDELHIEKRTREFNEVFVKRNGHIAKIDDVLNTLTVLIYSERDQVPIQDKEVVNYLSAYKLIAPGGPGVYTATEKQRCMEISDALSDYMDKLLENY